MGLSIFGVRVGDTRLNQRGASIVCPRATCGLGILHGPQSRAQVPRITALASGKRPRRPRRIMDACIGVPRTVTAFTAATEHAAVGPCAGRDAFFGLSHFPIVFKFCNDGQPSVRSGHGSQQTREKNSSIAKSHAHCMRCMFLGTATKWFTQSARSLLNPPLSDLKSRRLDGKIHWPNLVC